MIFPSLLNIKKLWRVMCFSCELPEIGRHIYHHQLPLLLLLLWLMMMLLPSLLAVIIIIAGTARAKGAHHSIFELL